MRGLRIGTSLVKILVKDRIHYPGRLIAETATIAARCGVLLLLYAYVFKLNGGEINGTTFIIAAWSMFFYFSKSLLRVRDITRLIAQDVKSGSVELLFSKPISYVLYRVWWQIGAGLYPFLVTTLLSVGVLVLLIGIPDTMNWHYFIPTLFLVFCGGVVLSSCIYVLVGLCAFWIEDINPLFWMIDKSIMILGGSYLPVALFPEFLYKLAIYSPFGAAQFVTHSVYESWQEKWHILISFQLGWIIVFLFLVVFVFERARKKVSVNGG